MPASFEKKVSVVVCTRNSRDRIEPTLSCLKAQDLNREEWEFLVVDNASDDGTFQWLQQNSAKYGFTLLSEEELGLSAARNRGIRESRGELVFFIDDDAVALGDYLSRLIAAYQVDRPECLGGPVHGLWSSTPPTWLNSAYWRNLSLVSWGTARRFLHPPEILIGTNVTFARRVFDEYGFFDTALGRKGSNLEGNEERELEDRIRARGGKVLYVPELCVFHLVNQDRMRVEYQERRFEDGAAGIVNIEERRQELLRLLQENPLKKLLRNAHDSVYFNSRSIYRSIKAGWEVFKVERRLQKASRRGLKRAASNLHARRDSGRDT